MSHNPRYAIYFVPFSDSLLYRFGADILGYDSCTGQHMPFADGIEAAIDGWKDLTANPRKYGFHSTLKAPLSLAIGKTEDELAAAIRTFAQTPRVIPVMRPVVRAISGFIAIVPSEPSPAIQKLADDCVTNFDGFRAPLTEDDRRRRALSALTQRQMAHMDRWGYPYVFDQFRFHMTLTGPLPIERQTSVLAILQKRFYALNLQTVLVDGLALLRQDEMTSNFKVISHWQLKARV